MARTRRILWSLLVVGVLGAASGVGTFAALSSTTTNTGNTFSAGTVIIADNDAGVAMLSLTSVAPGASDTSCIRVTYSGSLDSTVRIYGSNSGGLAPYLNLVVTRGSDPSPSYDACTNFTADATNYIGAGAGVVYSGTLSAFPTSYASGIVDPTSGSPETWSTSEAHSYRFTITLADDNAAQAQTATASFTWEARNT